ncbi:hypothetical protein AB1Y20_014484 [Prymnesium parvum]|uniref:Uncharacterized protein n=1 Tax=Prymnesium parvum TaxID=97485 RepID=A0AB34IFC2_PRYPA
MAPPRRRAGPRRPPASASASRLAARVLEAARELADADDPSTALRAASHALHLTSAAPPVGAPPLLAPHPPPSVLAALSLALLAEIHATATPPRLAAARDACEASLRRWKANGAALCRLAAIELHHGDARRARALYEAAAALPPLRAPRGGWAAALLAAPRAAAAAEASGSAALLALLDGDANAAASHLRRLGARLRLSEAVWDAVRHAPPRRALPSPRGEGWEGRGGEGVERYVGVVPPALLRQLRAAFGPRAPFWEETAYLERGYMSFWYDVSRPAESAVEAVAARVLPLLRCGGAVVGCEWWVHSKAASRALGNRHGHQLHFDTEEGVLYAHGEVRHPAVSAVLYLSGSAAAGPTVVLNQAYAATAPATHAYVSHPADGTLLLFPGHLLHGVCPAPTAAPPPRRRRADLPSALLGAASLPRRLTLMIGFWTEDLTRRVRRPPLSACAPTPRPSRRCTWPATLALPPGGGGAGAEAEAVREEVCVVSPAWEEVEAAPAGAAEAWQGLRVPEAIDNHFFVRGMDDFLFDHLEAAR